MLLMLSARKTIAIVDRAKTLIDRCIDKSKQIILNILCLQFLANLLQLFLLFLLLEFLHLLVLVIHSLYQHILEPIAGKISSAQEAETAVYSWLKSVGVPNKLRDEGFTEADISNLVNLAFTTPSLDGLLGIAPTEATREAVAQIYTNSL